MTEAAIDPVDPNVRVPAAVARAAVQAEQMIEQMKAPPEPAPDITATVSPEPAPQPEPQPGPVQTPPAVAAPQEQPQPTPPAQEDENNQTWKQRYHSMEGRFKQAMGTVSSMQTQMREMGDELVRMQEFIKNSANVTLTPQGQPVQKLVTDKDREVFGDELIDTVQRAALEAVAPKLSEIEQENQRLRKQHEQQRIAGVWQSLDGMMPNWRDINRSPRFKQWLSLRDLLTGSARGQLLNDAFKAADAPRVAAFFQAFVQDEQATGSTEFAPSQTPQPPAPRPAPRQPAMALEALAAPGRAKPAAQDTGRPADKPVFTRAQISSFYHDVHRGVYAGRQADKEAQEKAIFLAQNEGRVRN